MIRTKNYILLLVAVMLLMIAPAHAQQWPALKSEAKPGARWWWLGSAVDKENLKWNISQYAQHGIGALEITPIYGVQGNEAQNIPYLSDRWMEMLRYTQEQCRQNGIELDMATGTGWPFGGPWVPLEESACRVIFVEKEMDAEGVWTTVNGFRGLKPDQADTKAIDISLSERDAKNAVLHKVMLYTADGIYDVTNHVAPHSAPEGATIDLTGIIGAIKTKKASKANEGAVRGAKLIAVYIKYGVMKVKRAAPGGEGLVVDHFDKKAVANYLKHIEEAFERTHTPYPHTFFNDSYEVADATWTPTLFEEFYKRRGYKLEEHLPELCDALRLNNEGQMKNDTNGGSYHLSFINSDLGRSPLSDYRETLGDLLLENFTEQWTAWAHKHGAITRNQAHGSPANLIDCYAAVDIPEIEGFGLSELGIKGLRTDPGKTRKNDSDFSMLKYAPSAAHVTGKPLTSSETFTWLTEHFRTSLSQLKPDIDLMFCAGVNRMFFHGTCYSPKDDPWPGWKFYASIDMSPTNSIWRDAPYFMQYVEWCQSFLQWGEPDNDFLVYVPVRDAWQKPTGKLLMQFSIHDMGRLMPEFRQTILEIDKAGFDCDYISERLLLTTTFADGALQTAAGTRYKGLIIPSADNIMTDQLRRHIEALKAQGANIIVGTNAHELSRAAKAEEMRSRYGLKTIRRKNANGHHYFIANLSPNDVDARIPLAVDFKGATWFNPLNGDISMADFNNDGIGITLRSGESMILQTYDERSSNLQMSASSIDFTLKHAKTPHVVNGLRPDTICLEGPWTLSFVDEAPRVDKTYQLNTLQTWETLDEQTKVTMGTGVYTTKFKMKKKDEPKGAWKIDLGDVRESARVYINGMFIGCAWSAPFILDTKQTLKAGVNEIRIEVTNLPANRIAELDRQGVKWRKMEEINVVDINYKNTTYDQWAPMPSGLNGAVRLFREY